MIELTLDQVKRNPSMFMYVFLDTNAGRQFVSQLGKYRTIVWEKCLNQKRVLGLSARKYGYTFEQYVNAVNDAFKEAYGMSPLKAMQTLAAGGEVAGKNWSKGIFGVGATRRNNWVQNTDVTVDPETGKILYLGNVYPNQSAIYGKNYTCYTADIAGVTYGSQYIKGSKKYVAGNMCKEGKTYNADGKEVSAADSSNIWESIQLFLNDIMEWLIKIFNPESEGKMLTEAKVVPQQTNDGWGGNGGGLIDTLQSNAGLVLLALGAGTLLMTGNLPGFKGKKGKKNRK